MISNILRLPQVLSASGLSRSTIYDRMARNEFPKPISLGGSRARAVGWLEKDIEAWIQQRITESRKAARIVNDSLEAA